MPPGITIVGLGPGDPQLLTRAAWEALSQAEEVWLRTRHHPAVAALPADRLHSFDDLYETAPDFERVYDAIVERLTVLGRRPHGVVYAVPGDATVGEASAHRLLATSRVPVRVIHGLSCIEPSLAAVGADALDGLSIVDALELAAAHHPPFPPDRPALIAQLYSALVAADVKLTLMAVYPDEHPVRLIHAAGAGDAQVEALPLYAIDRSPSIGPMTSLFVPELPEPSGFESFQETVAHLRAPDGCPWDREQTPQSLRPHLLEEAYEALHALDEEDSAALREELGDLLLQIVLQAQIASEEGDFDMGDVIRGINAKIVRRHPHVFGEVAVTGVEHVLQNWEVLKAAERAENGEGGGLLGGVPVGLPALAQAAEIQSRVARVGFDWPDVEGVTAKIAEELTEVQNARRPPAVADEMGDVLFAVVNYARWLGVDPEAALRQANARFRRRFAAVEAAAASAGRPMAKMTPDELDALWEAAKGGEVSS
jgi:tetrapyrrole methylase family protein / MazG family protein